MSHSLCCGRRGVREINLSGCRLVGRSGWVELGHCQILELLVNVSSSIHGCVRAVDTRLLRFHLSREYLYVLASRGRRRLPLGYVDRAWGRERICAAHGVVVCLVRSQGIRLNAAAPLHCAAERPHCGVPPDTHHTRVIQTAVYVFADSCTLVGQLSLLAWLLACCSCRLTDHIARIRRIRELPQVRPASMSRYLLLAVRRRGEADGPCARRFDHRR